MNEENVSLDYVLDVVRKRIKIIVIIPAIAIILATVANLFFLKPKYVMSTKLFVGNAMQQEQKYDNGQVDMYQKLMKTYIEIARSSDLIQKALEYRGINENAGSVANALSVQQVIDTQVLEISYTSTETVVAPIVLDAIVEEFMKEAQELIPNGNVYVLEEVKIPEIPSAPHVKMNILLVGMLSFIICLSIVLFLGYIDSSVKMPEELERIMDTPVFGVIPKN